MTPRNRELQIIAKSSSLMLFIALETVSGEQVFSKYSQRIAIATAGEKVKWVFIRDFGIASYYSQLLL